MTAADGNSLLAVVVIPLVCGGAGLLLVGPFGFFLGVVLALVVGASVRETSAERARRIEELERRVDELEGRDES